MIEFIEGPLVWIGFAGFALGLLFKVIVGIARLRRDPAIAASLDGRFSLRSILHWVVPFGSHNMRRHPVFTAASFLFHAALLLTPLLAMGHAVLWERSLGLRWPSLPPGLTDGLTLLVVALGLLFLLRRLVLPEVRRVSGVREALLLLLVISPFITGYAAHAQWFDHRVTVALHIVSGVAWLIAWTEPATS